jgi:acyl-CoA thioester hydrolase
MPRTPQHDRPPVAVHSIEVRVRYPECDPMGVVHHAVYPVWFEMGRTEMLRAAGGSYRDMEAAGVFLAVVRIEVKYRRPARYDDVLRLETSLVSPGPVKIEHAYRLFRGDDLLAEGRTTLACLDHAGCAHPVPGTNLAPACDQPGESTHA